MALHLGNRARHAGVRHKDLPGGAPDDGDISSRLPAIPAARKGAHPRGVLGSAKGQAMKGRTQARAEIAAQAQRMERDLSVIRRTLRKPLEAEVAKGELTVPQSAVMQVVVRQNGISLKDLSREVSLAHSTVSGIVDRLEK